MCSYPILVSKNIDRLRESDITQQEYNCLIRHFVDITRLGIHIKCVRIYMVDNPRHYQPLSSDNEILCLLFD